MKTATVYSPCECQARLHAEVDQHRVVVRGWARDARTGEELIAPANAILREGTHFDVGWLCPFCTRNALRSFDGAALGYRDTALAAPSTTTAPS